MANGKDRRRVLQRCRQRALAKLGQLHPAEFSKFYTKEVKDSGDRPRNQEFVEYGKLGSEMYWGNNK